jgi:hypothetical protein
VVVGDEGGHTSRPLPPPRCHGVPSSVVVVVVSAVVRTCSLSPLPLPLLPPLPLPALVVGHVVVVVSGGGGGGGGGGVVAAAAAVVVVVVVVGVVVVVVCGGGKWGEWSGWAESRAFV